MPPAGEKKRTFVSTDRLRTTYVSFSTQATPQKHRPKNHHKNTATKITTKYCHKSTATKPPTVVVCSQATVYFFQTTLFESSAKKGRMQGRMQNRMESGHRMGSVQQVRINPHRHIFLLVYTLYLLKLPAPPCAPTTGNIIVCIYIYIYMNACVVVLFCV